MGNCCGRESDNFAGEGRTLGAAPANAPPQSSGARASAPPKISSQGRTLGYSSRATDGSPSPREAAARAAEERAKAANAPGGKLQNNLQGQKNMTTQQLLQKSADENRAAREADAAAQARNYD